MAIKARSTLIVWHRWFGVFAALWLALMGITGSVVVFYTPLDNWLNPDLRISDNTGSMQPVENWVAAAEQYRPGGSAYFIDVPNGPSETAYISLTFPDTGQPDVNVYVDPYTGQVLGERQPEVFSLHRRHIVNLFYGLHIDLLLGEGMLWFLGLVSFLWLVDHILVLGISFPAATRWFASFLIRPGVSGVKFQYDLHRAAGLWLFPVTLMLAVSGLYFNWNHEFETVVDRFSPINPRHIWIMEPHTEPVYAPEVSFDEAVGTARQRAGRDVDIVNYYPYLRAYMARAFDERDVDSHARRLITIDANSGAILADQHAASGSAGDIFMLWQYPLHSGKAFGWPGRIVIFLSGIMLTAICVTGLLIWWRKRRARSRESKQSG